MLSFKIHSFIRQNSLSLRLSWAFGNMRNSLERATVQRVAVYSDSSPLWEISPHETGCRISLFGWQLHLVTVSLVTHCLRGLRLTAAIGEHWTSKSLSSTFEFLLWSTSHTQRPVSSHHHQLVVQLLSCLCGKGLSIQGVKGRSHRGRHEKLVAKEKKRGLDDRPWRSRPH